MPDYYKFSEPDASRKLLETYAIFNDNLREFWEELREQFVWSLLPWDFLYDLYVAWSKRNNPSGRPQSKSSFKMEMREVIKNDPVWMVYTKPDGKDGQVRPGRYILDPEPLITEYSVSNWEYLSHAVCDPPFITNRNHHMNISQCKTHYTGLVRRFPKVGAAQPSVLPETDWILNYAGE